jgi:hypothetical protein
MKLGDHKGKKRALGDHWATTRSRRGLFRRQRAQRRTLIYSHLQARRGANRPC